MTMHRSPTRYDHSETALITVAGELGELRAGHRHLDKRVTALERKHRKPPPTIHKGDWLQIVIGATSLLLAARGIIPWETAAKLLGHGN